MSAKNPHAPSNPKILTIDIETLPLEGLFWGTGEQNVDFKQIKTEWSILSYCAKWYGSKEILYADTMGRGAAKVRDDSRLLAPLHALLDEADIIIAQNGKKFDVRKINARLIMAGYLPYSPVRVIDTYIETKRIAAFTSHKLAWMSEYLTDTPKEEHRLFPGLELWKECLKDNPKARRELKKYNCTDVVATEKVYERIKGWITQHPNRAAYTRSAGLSCLTCGSTRLRGGGYHTNQNGRYHRHQCLDCGKWGHEKTNLLTKTERSRLLVN